MSADAAAPVTPAPAPTTTPAADPALDTRLATLSKREREIQQQIAAFKQEKQGMVPKSELSSLWKSDRAKLREMLGVSADELPDLKPEASKPDDPIKSLREELDSFKRQKQEEEQHKATTEFKANLSGFIQKDKDAYELLNAFEATDMVFDYMVDHYKANNGEELDYKTAADHVESYLMDQIKKASGTKKIGSLFQQSQGQKQEPSPTLTGSMVTSPGSSPRRLSEEESKAEAAKMIKWRD